MPGELDGTSQAVDTGRWPSKMQGRARISAVHASGRYRLAWASVRARRQDLAARHRSFNLRPPLTVEDMLVGGSRDRARLCEGRWSNM